MAAANTGNLMVFQHQLSVLAQSDHTCDHANCELKVGRQQLQASIAHNRIEHDPERIEYLVKIIETTAILRNMKRSRCDNLQTIAEDHIKTLFRACTVMGMYENSFHTHPGCTCTPRVNDAMKSHCIGNDAVTDIGVLCNLEDLRVFIENVHMCSNINCVYNRVFNHMLAAASNPCFNIAEYNTLCEFIKAAGYAESTYYECWEHCTDVYEMALYFMSALKLIHGAIFDDDKIKPCE